MDTKKIKNTLEALFFITDKPITFSKLKDIFGSEANEKTLKESINELRQEYISRNSPIELREIAEGFQFANKPEYGPWIRKLYKERTVLRLSQSALETLSIIAYKQPVTRAEIEEIRGVEVTAVLERLLERKIIRIVGRKETVGRPLIYGTTQEFLRYFGLRSLSELPSLEELTQPEEIASSDQSKETTDSEQSEETT